MADAIESVDVTVVVSESLIGNGDVIVDLDLDIGVIGDVDVIVIVIVDVIGNGRSQPYRCAVVGLGRDVSACQTVASQSLRDYVLYKNSFDK